MLDGKESRLSSEVEHVAFNHVVVGSIPTDDNTFEFLHLLYMYQKFYHYILVFTNINIIW